MLAVALGGGGGSGGGSSGSGGGKTPVGGATKEPVGGASKEPVEQAGTTTKTPAGAEPDPLCVAYETLAGTVDGLGTIEGPGDLEVFVTAQLTFHTAAAGIEPAPDRDAFAAMAAWYEAQRAFYSARGWQQQVDVADAALVPRPPADGSPARTAEILAERCGDAIAAEAPASEAPASEAPASNAPTSNAPASETPASAAPATGAPASNAPASAAPASGATASNTPG